MSKFSLKKKEYKISEQVGKDSVMEFLEFYDVDVDTISDPKAKMTSENIMEKLLRAYRAGKLENKINNGNFNVIQTVSGKNGEEKELIYTELRAKNKLAMDAQADDQFYARVYGLLGSLSNVTIEGIKKLNAQDLGIAECVGFVFLAA